MRHAVSDYIDWFQNHQHLTQHRKRGWTHCQSLRICRLWASLLRNATWHVLQVNGWDNEASGFSGTTFSPRVGPAAVIFCCCVAEITLYSFKIKDGDSYLYLLGEYSRDILILRKISIICKYSCLNADNPKTLDSRGEIH